MSIPPKNLERRNSGGFALVIALSLMAFVLLLVIAMSTLVRVETRSAKIAYDRLQARQAAQLSAYLALGDIQKQLGPDQRISAKAAIQDADASSRAIDGVFQSNWLGVWDGEARHSDHLSNGLYDAFNPNPDAYQLKWLVSGNEQQDDFLPSEDPNASTTPYIELVSETQPGRDDAVRAPLVEAEDGSIAYAWWVGDLGMSAKVGAQTDSNALYTSDLLAPRRTGLAVLDEFSSARAAPELLNDLDRISSEKQIEILDWVSAPSDGGALQSKYSHDVAVMSAGVLADPRRGGLKKDLTAGLQPGASLPSGQIFDPIASDVGLLDRGGPEWEQLRSYYNLRPDSGGAVPIQEMTDSQMGIHPVVTYMNFGYTMSLVRPGGVAPEHFDDIGDDVTVRFHLHPIIVLWNPYNRPLAAHTYHWYLPSEGFNVGARVVFSDRGLYNQGQAQAATYVMSNHTSNPHPLSVQLPKDSDANLNKIFRANSSEDHGSFKFAIESPVLQPGEAIVFSPSGYEVLETASQSSYEGASSNNWNRLLPGWRNDTYFYQDTTVANGIDWSTVSGVSDLSQIEVKDILMLPVNTYGNSGNSVNSIIAKSPETATTAPLVYFDQQRIWASSSGSSNNYEGDLLSGGSSAFSLSSVPRWKNGQSTRELQIIDSGNAGRLDFDASVAQKAYPAFGYQVQLVLSESETLHDLEQASMQFRWLANVNPRASLMGRTPFEGDSAQVGPVGYNGRFYRKSDDHTFMDSFDDVGFVGLNVFDPNVERCVLFDIASDESELSSIGSFMHADLARTGIDGGDGILDVPWNTAKSQFNFVQNNAAPAYAIGNSNASPWVAASRAYRRGTEWGVSTSTDHVYYDQSYMLNDQLWDQFFLSTVPHESGRDASRPYNSAMQPSELADLEDLRDRDLLYEQAAAHMKVQGMFNVNSTSVRAWEVLLSSYLGVQPEGTTLDVTEAPFVRFLSDDVSDQAFQGGDDLDPYFEDSYISNRYLTVTEISQLAESIVEQVKLRGPFFSMSQFVNRVLTDDLADDARLSGVLQSAIHDGTVDLNGGLSDTFISKNDIEPSLSGNLYQFEHMEGARAEGIASSITQADLLARLGAGLNARSDTFVVRGYGEVRDPISGEVRGSSKCEFVVQREPNFVDAGSDDAWTALDQLNSQTNRTFGRKFSIISVRFLDEI